MKVKRRIAIGDIHGCYDLMVELIENVIKFDASGDELVFIGDYIDRGPDNVKVVSYADYLKKNHPDRVVLLIGNHELLALNALKTRMSNEIQLWFINGGNTTLINYGSFDNALRQLIPFIGNLQYYYETTECIFVHGGIPAGETLESAPLKSLLWDRSYDRYTGKLIVVGHTPHKKVTKYKSSVVIDTGAVYYGKLSAYDVLNDKVYEAYIPDK